MNLTPRFVHVAALAAVLAAMGARTLCGQEQSPPAPAPSKDAPPTLDELLGITKDNDAAEQTAGRETDLIEKLTGAEEAGGGDVASLFLEAVQSMEMSASLLLDQRSAGLQTQRYQEAALLKLDSLISQAQRQSQQQQQQSQQQQQQQQQAPQQQQGQQQGQSPGTEASRDGDNRPALRETDLDGAIDETGTEWGNLPPRVRELLRQGRGDAAARLYQRLTEIYYQRLAEESQP